MYSWLTFYHSSHEVAKDHKPHMTELQSRIQTTRDHFNASREDIHALMRKMLEVRQSVSKPHTGCRNGFEYKVVTKAREYYILNIHTSGVPNNHK